MKGYTVTFTGTIQIVAESEDEALGLARKIETLQIDADYIDFIEAESN